MIVASGTRRGSALKHAVHVGPDDDLRRVEQRAEDRRREVAAVAAERRLQPFARARDEAGDDERGARIARNEAVGVGARLRPEDARAERRRVDLDDLARVDPANAAGAAAPRLEVAREEARRPDLAESGDEVADDRRRDANQPDGLQDAGDVAAVGFELLDVVVGRRRGEQRAGDADVPLPDRLEPSGIAVLAGFGGVHERQQRVGDALARRQHRRHARQRVVLENLRDPLHAGGVRHAGAAEFVYAPRFHARSLCIDFEFAGQRRVRRSGLLDLERKNGHAECRAESNAQLPACA